MLNLNLSRSQMIGQAQDQLSQMRNRLLERTYNPTPANTNPAGSILNFQPTVTANQPIPIISRAQIMPGPTPPPVSIPNPPMSQPSDYGPPIEINTPTPPGPPTPINPMQGMNPPMPQYYGYMQQYQPNYGYVQQTPQQFGYGYNPNTFGNYQLSW